MKRIFQRRYQPKAIYLLTTEVISNYNNGTGIGPTSVTQYYLAKKKGNTFYELFSKVKLKKENSAISGFTSKKFNIPIIKEVDSMEAYVKKPDTEVTAEELFHFITALNAEEMAFCIAKKGKRQ